MLERLIIATGNAGKAREFSVLLQPFAKRIELLPAGVAMPEEDGSTFAENALKKAQAVSAQTGLPALADDSGLRVDALNGAPGVYSARFAGPGATDSANIDRLLALLTGVAQERRGAEFVAALALVVPGPWAQAAGGGSAVDAGAGGAPEPGRVARGVTDGGPAGGARVFAAEGRVRGTILPDGRGAGGFGYDRVFYYPPLGRTFAELSLEEKDAVSHRRIALRALAEKLRDVAGFQGLAQV